MVYLKKIVFRGFKSFGRKTVSLRFSKGLTAVVGANGSGKSNVLDAICFTLGILSAKFVRAGSFSDLIYKPGSPAGEKPAEYARVTLHCDNSDRKIPIDSDDIVISRQVDRQGHGVYRLNGRLTTRTEILDILSMVGIDPEGYNIVPQGELARIIRLSHEERRQLIEKIAGIATYDEKKERALKELDEVNQNLQRINDRVKLAKDDLDRLEREREDAVRWQKRDVEIRNLQAALIFTQLTRDRLASQEVAGKIAERKKQLNELETNEANLAKISDELSNKISEIEPTLAKKEAELEEAQLRTIELRQQASESENASNLIQEKMNSNLSQLKSLEEKLPALKRATENAWNEVRTLEDKKKALLKNIEDTNGILQGLSTQISGLDNEFDKKREKLESIVAEIGLLNAESSKTLARQQILSREKTYVEQEVEKLRRLREESERGNMAVKDELNSLKKEQGESEYRLTGSRAKLGRVDGDISTAQKQLGEVDATVRKVRDELVRVKARMDAFREAKMYLSHGRKAAIREILRTKEREGSERVCGTITDLIEVPAQYSTAIEASAGYRLGYVVTKSEDDAARLIDLLKRSKTGRASFLPLDALRVGGHAEYPKLKGVIGLAKDLIRFDRKFDPAIDYIFGKTLIVEDLSVARSLKHTDLRRVTLEGDIVEPTGLITGGFYAKGKHLTEKRTLVGLEEELKGFEETRETLSDKLQSSAKLRSELIEHINADERKLEVSAVQLNEKSKKIKELEQIIESTQSELRLKNVRLQEIAKDLTALNDVLEKSKDNLSRLSSQEESLKRLLDTSEASEIGKIVKERENELSKLNNELKKIEISIAQNLGKIEQLTPQNDEVRRLQEQARAAMPSLQSELEVKLTKLDTLNDELKTISTGRDLTKEEVESLKKELSDTRNSARDVSKKLGAARREINALQMDINGLEIRKEHLESEVVSGEKRIQEFPEFQSSLTADIDEEDISAKIHMLREEQVAQGNVNMKAIEQYDTTKKASDEIVSRREKVLQEKTSILEFMEKIEREKLRKFMETFNDISNNFREIFDYLSPTIRAELVIENVEQPLLGGIAIKVKTSGMEVTNIEALSGGEKSLTALALIFAIQKHQPAPFYVLDEIDAFLDEVNAVRVADLLKELSKNSQFIVVTLKQAVMSRADTLIGISKNTDTGVSNIVSANIEDFTKVSAA